MKPINNKELLEALNRKRRHWWQFWIPRKSIVEQQEELKRYMGEMSGVPDVFKGKRVGRVIKAKKAPEYEPVTSTKGGRVVRQIPKSLKKIKEAQENKDAH